MTQESMRKSPLACGAGGPQASAPPPLRDGALAVDLPPSPLLGRWRGGLGSLRGCTPILANKAAASLQPPGEWSRSAVEAWRMKPGEWRRDWRRGGESAGIGGSHSATVGRGGGGGGGRWCWARGDVFVTGDARRCGRGGRGGGWWAGGRFGGGEARELVQMEILASAAVSASTRRTQRSLLETTL
ncbi:hypothetical protein I4F81_002584 [Pyropia yezoensis]|uniref:Uncharacterized protein n=1 Tax=Pyropia yezoensis TaxID=2788 RepID=A0ACC3BR43_PYRYE|nr:hypothetical protein I4F81_002584 [Neopyropia yezoensis]